MIYVCTYLSVLRGVTPQMLILDFTCRFTVEPLDVTTSFRDAVLSTTLFKSIRCQLSLQVTPLGFQKNKPPEQQTPGGFTSHRSAPQLGLVALTLHAGAAF